MSEFTDTLVERRIWRVLLAYPSVTFIWLQVVEFFINNYGFDERWLTVSLIIAIVMFPAAVVWNWKHGEAGSQSFSGPEITSYIVFGIMAAFAGGWYWNETPSSTRTAIVQLEPARTLAVMPFDNAGGDADVQFLCDGIAESLINWLATVPDVKVVSRSAAFRLREFADDTDRLAAELGVDGVVRGSLQRVGEQIVISASFVDTRDESQVWGDRFDQPATELINLERSIVELIKEGLRLEVSDANPTVSASGGTDDAAAYEHYLRGHFLIQSTNTAEINEGLEELRAAIRIDPQFARPYADIADALAQMVYFGIVTDDNLISEARSAAYTAVALAPDLAEAQAALASMLQFIELDWRAVDAAYDAAVALSPQSPVTYYRYADYLVFTNRPEAGREMAARAIAQDPLDSSSMHAVGFTALFSRDFEAAAKALGDWNRFHPNSRWSYIKHAFALAMNDQCEEALGQASTVENLMNHDPSPLADSWLAWTYHVCGDSESYSRSIGRIRSKMAAAPDGIDPGYAYMYALEGDVEALVDLLYRIADANHPLTFALSIFEIDYLGWPISGQMGDHERYQALLERLDFP